jgi:prepilin signal peptidase PulO-like enzyme (type II secretory pathway)
MLGLVMADPLQSLLLLFMAALLGSFISIPLMMIGKAGRNTRIPFGPFLLMAGFIVILFGASIIGWYERIFLPY